MTDKIELSVAELKEWQDQRKAFHLIDIREPWERDIARLQQDTHIPLAQLGQDITPYSKDKIYVVYCHHGRRSLVAINLMKEAGFKTVYSLEGGIDAWSHEIDQKISTY